LLVLTVLSIACGGGGGGGGGGGPTQPPVPPGINFTPAKAATNNSLYLAQGAQTSPAALFLEVRVSNVEELYGVAFDLLYPSNLLSYVGVTEGSFFPPRRWLQVAVGEPGRLIVGHTKLGDDDAEDGSGLLMTLEFAPVGNGSGSISFDDQQAFRPGSLPKTIEWIAGNVSVRQ
jgi:hypothetical protein